MQELHVGDAARNTLGATRQVLQFHRMLSQYYHKIEITARR